MNILHIESSNFFKETFRDIVKELNSEFVIFGAINLSDAYKILQVNKIDLIVTALEIDGKDGEEIITELNNSEFSDIPILVFTSTDDIAVREKLFNLGVVDYIIKNDISIDKIRNYIGTLNRESKIDNRAKELPIAVVDDSYLSLKIIKNILEPYGFKDVDYYSDPLDILECNKEYSIYLVDLILPNISGEDLMLEFKKNNPKAIIILISNISNYKTISNILFLGADDYILKPFDTNVFIARLLNQIKSYFLIEDLEEKNEILAKMANTDGLTDIYNHKYAVDFLIKEKERTIRYNSKLSIIMMDIDNFKKVNDMYGHLTGDDVLYNIAQIIKEHIRKIDLVGRYGGEEFIVVLPETDKESAFIVADKLRKAIEAFNFDGINHKVTISGGIAEYKVENNNNLISDADENLYKAKNEGKNRIVWRD
ncbi:response regulator [Helicovermis profundi]|uniref:Stage 0 sporulation protein A homolog n=1 Tax=Helicovermis profundi TaxID=3065157 RepID=A0AAU9E562_9FIRM|nr:hypothetical protein HLPR_19190 [Clostridia bacterium S502]